MDCPCFQWRECDHRLCRDLLEWGRFVYFDLDVLPSRWPVGRVELRLHGDGIEYGRE